MADSLASDVVILGGGPAGLAVAAGVVRRGLRTIVIERADYYEPRVGEHLAPDCKALLKSLDLAAAVDTGRHASCPGIRSAWGTAELLDRDYLFHPMGEGLNLFRPDFDRSLATEVVRLGVKVWTHSRVCELERRRGAWRLSIDRQGSAGVISADFLIDATGRSAALARRLGARLHVYDRLVGLVGRARGPRRADLRVVIEALEDGWWYSAGLQDGTLVATFFTDPDIADLTKTARDSTWRSRLRKAPNTGIRSSALLEIGHLHARCAGTQRLDRAAGEGWLAVGDAAMSFDPLSSDGISKGIKTAVRAAAAVSALLGGEADALQNYQDDLRHTFSEYLVARYRYYRAEKRWSNAPFWHRRGQRMA
jgi:flavin-dependent dehydrogenase